MAVESAACAAHARRCRFHRLPTASRTRGSCGCNELEDAGFEVLAPTNATPAGLSLGLAVTLPGSVKRRSACHALRPFRPWLARGVALMTAALGWREKGSFIRRMN